MNHYASSPPHIVKLYVHMCLYCTSHPHLVYICTLSSSCMYTLSSSCMYTLSSSCTYVHLILISYVYLVLILYVRTYHPCLVCTPCPHLVPACTTFSSPYVYRHSVDLYHAVVKQEPGNYLGYLCMGTVFLSLMQQRKSNVGTNRRGLLLQVRT